MSSPVTLRAVQDLMDEYVDLIDSDRLEQWVDLFAEGCVYRVTSRENEQQNLPVSIWLCSNKNMLRDRITSLRNANEYNLHYDRHLVTNVRVESIEQGTAKFGANYAVLQTTVEGRTTIFNTGRYKGRAAFEGETLRLQEMVAVMDTFAVPTLLATPL